jgi:hypothetical protein
MWELVEERRGTGRFDAAWYTLRTTGRPSVTIR